MKDISELYAEPNGSLFEDYHHPELERLSEIGDNEHFKILTVEERRCIRYYFQHRRGEIAFSISWLKGIDSAIAHINQFKLERASKRLVIFDKRQELYWAGLGITKPWCKTKARALLFSEKDRHWLSQLCDRSNRSTRNSRRFVVVEIEASKRLAKNNF